MLIVCTLKNPGEGFCCLARSQKPGSGVCADRVLSQKTQVRGVLSVFALKYPGEGRVDRVRSQKPLVGRVLTVLALKNPGRVDRARSQKPWWGFWNLNFPG